MTGLVYFSYGSNMSRRRLQERVREVGPAMLASLPGHRLAFHKRGRDGSAKCDIQYTGDRDDRVVGVLFSLPNTAGPVLDACEGLGNGYQRKQVQVLAPDGVSISATTYYATRIDHSLKPFKWYRAHVLAGAREHGLPPDYVASIERVRAIDDPDPDRHAREMSIYR